MTDIRLDIQQTQKLNQDLQTAIRLLSLDLDGLNEEINKAVSENPALEYVPPKKSAHDYAIQIKAHYSVGRGGKDISSDIPAAGDTPRSDLEQQLRLSGLAEDILRVAEYMLQQLTPRGYFAQDIDEFAAECNVPPHTAREALEAIQALEPAGIGARTVEECLKLQLRERGDADPLCYDLIRLYLLEIGKGNIRQIAKETGATVAHIRQCVQTIRSLNPIPCSLREEAIQYTMPEFSVETDAGDNLSIQFHTDYYAGVRRDETFLRLAKTLPPEEQAYTQAMLASASQLIQAIKMRQSTMEKIARIIVREQRAFFLGVYNLLPLRIDEAAQEVGVHETTVYRALQNKYLYCSRGTYPLSHFFQRELKGGKSPAAVKEMIRRLCLEKGKMSDREISEELEKQGTSVSRRTVAKYRTQMDIDSSFRRGADERECV